MEEYNTPFYSSLGKIEKLCQSTAFQQLVKTQKYYTDILGNLAKPYSGLSEFTKKINSLKFDYLKLNPLAELKNNPELHYIYISDSNELNIAFIEDSVLDELPEKMELINANISPALEHLSLISLWNGATESLNSNNPDKLRHCLISLRTLLEYLINVRLAPIEILSKDPDYSKKIKGKKILKVDRFERVKFFTSKIQFGLLEEFTQNDIECILKCYDQLCLVHEAEIGLSENQVKILTLKTGIILWLLLSLDKLLNDTDYATNETC